MCALTLDNVQIDALQGAVAEGSANLVIAVQQAIATYEQALAACPYPAMTHAG